jgi:hypothetical protein
MESHTTYLYEYYTKGGVLKSELAILLNIYGSQYNKERRMAQENCLYAFQNNA